MLVIYTFVIRIIESEYEWMQIILLLANTSLREIHKYFIK